MGWEADRFVIKVWYGNIAWAWEAEAAIADTRHSNESRRQWKSGLSCERRQEVSSIWWNYLVIGLFQQSHFRGNTATS